MHIKLGQAPTDMRTNSHPKTIMKCHFNNSSGKPRGPGLWCLAVALFTLASVFRADAATPLFEAKSISIAGEPSGNGAIDPGETVTLSFKVKNISKTGSTKEILKGVSATLQVDPSGSGDVAYADTVTMGDFAVDEEKTVTITTRIDGTTGAVLKPVLVLKGKNKDNNDFGAGGTVANGDFTGITPSAPDKFHINIGKKEERIITQTGGAITINDFKSNSDAAKENGRATPYPSTLSVSGIPNEAGRTGERVVDVSVTLNGISHAYTRDLAVILASPKQGAVTLMRNAGGGALATSGVSGISLTFSNGASGQLPQNAQIIAGSYKVSDYGVVADPASTPASSGDLAKFRSSVLPGADATITQTTADAETPNGDWKLYVVDGSAGFSGTISSWSISFTVRKYTGDNAGSTDPYILSSKNINKLDNKSIDEDNTFVGADTSAQFSTGSAHTSKPVFTVADLETAGDALTLAVVSGNESLIKSSNIKLSKSGAKLTGGTDASRKYHLYDIDFQPEANQSGETSVTVTVTDSSGRSASKTFTLTVTSQNDAPKFATFPVDQKFNQGTTSPLLEFSVSDIETSVTSLIVSVARITAQGAAVTAAAVDTATVELTGVGSQRFIKVIPKSSTESGSATIHLNVTDSSGASNGTTPKQLIVSFGAQPGGPALAPIGTKSVNEDAVLALPVLIRSGSTTSVNSLTFASSVTVSGASTLDAVALSGISSLSVSLVAGSGENRTVNISAPANQNGTADVTLTFTDPANTTLLSSEKFRVNVRAVNDAPTITSISQQTINENNATSALAFTIGDVETSPTGATEYVQDAAGVGASKVVVTTDNATLLPASGLVVSAAGSANRTLTVTPASNKFGKATVTISVTDTATPDTLSLTTAQGAKTTSTSFLVFVNHVNNPPVVVSAGGVNLAANATDVVDMVAILEDANNTFVDATKSKGVVEQTITLAGVAPGAGESETDQTVTLSIVSVEGTAIKNVKIVAETNNDTTISFSSGTPTKNVRILYTPVTDASGDTTVTFKLQDNSGGPNDSTTRKIKIKITPVNDTPTLAAITLPTGAQTSKQGLVLRTTLTDVETTDGSKYGFSATSDNVALVPVANIVADPLRRFITVTPVSTVSGTVNIVFTFTDQADGTSAATTVSSPATGTTGAVTLVFDSTIVPNAAPVILSINGSPTGNAGPPLADIPANATVALTAIDEDGVATTSIILDDDRLATGGVTLSAVSKDQTIVKSANVLFGGVKTDGTRPVVIVPETDSAGNVSIEVNASDADGLSVTKTMTLLIRNIEKNPTISITKSADTDWSGTLAGNDLTFAEKEDTATVDDKSTSGLIEIVVRDSEQTGDSLTVAAVSSIVGVIKSANVAVDPTKRRADTSDSTGKAQIRAYRVTPEANQNSTTGGADPTITFTVTDSTGRTASAFFKVNVVPVNDAPTIAQVDPVTVNESHSDLAQTGIALTGITAGPATATDEAAQTVTLSVQSAKDEGKDTLSILTGTPTITGTTLNYTTKADRWGTVVVVVRAGDAGAANANKDMTLKINVLQVNQAPKFLSAIPNVTLPQNIISQSVTNTFSIADNDGVIGSPGESLPEQLTVTATSSDTTILPNDGVALQVAGTGSSRSVIMTPIPDKGGNVTVTLTVTDTGKSDGTDPKSVSETFALTISAPAKPVLSAFTNQATGSTFTSITNVLNADIPAITFTVRDGQSAAGLLTVDITSDNTTFVPNATQNLFKFRPDVSGTPGLWNLIVTPVKNIPQTANIKVKVTDPDGNVTESSFAVVSISNPPQISLIGASTTSPNTINTNQVFSAQLTVSDDFTPPQALSVTGKSSNQAFVKDSNIVLTGFSGTRALSVTPETGAGGQATITLTVSDLTVANSTNAVSFVLTTPIIANTTPTISSIANVDIGLGAAPRVVTFTVGDAAGETAVDSLVITRTSSNEALLAASTGILPAASGATRTLVLSPTAGQTGTATVTLTVTDTGTPGSDPKSASTSFTVTVAANNAPTISSIGNQTTSQNTALSGIAFTVGDSETAAASLVVTAASDKATVVVSTGITIAGSGANRTVAISPVANASGTATVTLTVTDAGGKTATSSFTVTVSALAGVKGDFNGDRQPDLLFQDSGGFLATWYMNGGKLTSADFLLPSNVGDPAFRVAATADFNRDGQEDVLFQSTDGTLAVWLMNGTQQASASLLTPSNPGDRNWQVAASGDVNRDGKADIVFQHTDGTLAVWYMDGTSLSSAALIEPANAGAGWKVVAVGDLNADGKTDLIFQHTDGTLAMWAMDGSKLTSAALLDPSNPGDAAWKVVGAAPIAKRLSIALSGAAERPTAVTTTATGSGTATLIGDKLTFSVSYSGLSGAASAAHIHGPATTEQAAGVLIDLAPFNGGAFGASGTLSGTVTLTSAQLASVRDGLTYVNIHTAANPGGEVRGQIVANSAKAGQVDLIFQRSDLTLAVWYLDGSKLSSAALLDPSNSGGSWKVVGPK